MIRLIFYGIVLVVAVLLLRRYFKKTIFKIKVTSSEIVIGGKVPGYGDSDVQQFISELGVPPGSVMKGVPDGKRYRIEFSAAVPEMQRQRVRNFFFLKLS